MRYLNVAIHCSCVLPPAGNSALVDFIQELPRHIIGHLSSLVWLIALAMQVTINPLPLASTVIGEGVKENCGDAMLRLCPFSIAGLPY